MPYLCYIIYITFSDEECQLLPLRNTRRLDVPHVFHDHVTDKPYNAHLAPSHKVKAADILDSTINGKVNYTKSIQFSNLEEELNGIQETGTA